MHRFFLLLTALTLTPLSTLHSSSQWQGLPGGTYTETCQDISVNGNTLQARCQASGGDWRQTSIDYRQCGGQIINDDGRLRCGEGSGSGAGHVGLPSGSYAETCHDIRTNGTVLQARCQKRDGSFHKTSIDYRQCGGRVFNDDGNLRCGEASGGYSHPGDYDDDDRRGGRQGGIPHGDYRQTCRNIRINGDKLEAECQERDGDWHGTSLDDFNRCRSEIVNNDGNLGCQK
jgi:major membrane immunogen (membrane-anchored lipoprotein)